MNRSSGPLALRHAVRLCALTVVWNAVAGTAAVAWGVLTTSLALVAFGLDAAIDSVASAALIWRFRSEQRDPSRADAIERTAVHVVGVALLLVGVYIGVQAIRSLITTSQSQSSAFGIALAASSLAVLPPLALLKGRVARRLASRALRGDSLLTAAGALLAGVALLSLAMNALLGWWWTDPVAGLIIAIALAWEGRRMLVKAAA